MKKLMFLFFLSPFFSAAQDRTLLAEGVSPSLYLNHKVAPKENYYSIGRIYNISPKDIAPFNNLQLESGLSLGQAIKIPLNSSNFFQSGNAAADETFVPVFYTVKDKEGLYRVAVNHNALPLETLRQWNNIKGDAVKNGTKLIVGYLKVKKDLSVLSKNGIGNSIEAKAVVKEEEKKTAADLPNKTVAAAEAVSPVNSQQTLPPGKDPGDEKKEATKPDAAQTKPVQSSNAGETKNTNTGNKEPVNPVPETGVTESNKTVEKDKNSIGGVFKELYESQVNKAETAETTGSACTFKSTSGWSDKKYYCLYNSASPGIIIKITNPANGKFVFAKVLDLMPDIKQNEGLLICLSNAAAAELGASEGNFNCLLNYSK